MEKLCRDKLNSADRDYHWTKGWYDSLFDVHVKTDDRQNQANLADDLLVNKRDTQYYPVLKELLKGKGVWDSEYPSLLERLARSLPYHLYMKILFQLHRKIVTGLGYKTMKRLSDQYFVDNAIRIDKEQYSLNSVGTCRIQHSEDENSVCLVIDGKRISMNEFGRALTTFEGFNMDFLIRDLSEEILGKDIVLRPVKINPAIIIADFERTLGWFLERNAYTIYLLFNRTKWRS